jgi:hypothetical protein
MNLVRLRSIVGVFFLVALVGVIGSPEAVAAATCNTFDANNTPTTAFSGGEKIIVRGTGFAANSIVLVNLLQGNRTIELERARANDLGAFEVASGTVPSSVSDGDAAIRALDARGSATCGLTLTAGEGSDESSLGGLFWVWGLGLALFGGVLALLTYRRWKAERLREAVDSLAWREQSEERTSYPDPRAEPVAVGSRIPANVSRAHQTDPSPSWTSDEQRPSWVTDGPRPSWARPDDERGFDLGGPAEPRDEIPPPTWTPEQPVSPWAPASDPRTDESLSTPWEPARVMRDDDPDRDTDSEPWEPGPARTEEPFTDEPAYRPPVQRPIPERPVPARPGPTDADAWTLDGDDDLSAIGAPRPFDDRFALDDDDVADADEPPPYRPAGSDERLAVHSAPPPRPVVSRPVPQRPTAPHESAEGEEGREPASRRAEERRPPPARAEPFEPDPFDREPVAPAPVEPPRAPVAPEPTAPAAPVAPAAGVGPHAPGVKAERDFASALRDFLDKEDMELDRRSGIVDRPAVSPPGGGLRSHDSGRIPQGPVRPSAPSHVPVPASAEPPGPVRPVAPHASQAPVEPVEDRPPHRAAFEPAGEPVRDVWRPQDVAEPRLQPGPIPSPPRAPVRPGAEPLAFDPLQHPSSPPASERPERERPVDLRETDPGLPPGAHDAGVSEPPVLPVGWDDGRLKPPPRASEDRPTRASEDRPTRASEDRPTRASEDRPSDDRPSRASDAIARLKREVRNWKR